MALADLKGLVLNLGYPQALKDKANVDQLNRDCRLLRSEAQRGRPTGNGRASWWSEEAWTKCAVSVRQRSEEQVLLREMTRPGE